MHQAIDKANASISRKQALVHTRLELEHTMLFMKRMRRRNFGTIEEALVEDSHPRN